MLLDKDLVDSFIKSLTLVKYTLTVSVPILIIVKYCDYAGYIKYLDKFAYHIVKRTNFLNVTGKAFLANLGSVYAGSALLLEKYEKKELSRTNLILSVIFAGFLPRIRILLTYTLPVVISLLTPPLVIFYAIFSLFNTFFRLAASVILSKIMLNDKNETTTKTNNIAPTPEIPKVAKSIFFYPLLNKAIQSSLKLTFKIVIHILIITTIFNYLQLKGLFEFIPLKLSFFGLPQKCDSAFYAYIAHTYSGISMIGSFLTEGRITTLAGIKLLLFCMMATRPIVAIKEAPSYYFGVYGIKNGSIIVFTDLVIFMITGLITFYLLSFIS